MLFTVSRERAQACFRCRRDVGGIDGLLIGRVNRGF